MITEQCFTLTFPFHPQPSKISPVVHDLYSFAMKTRIFAAVLPSHMLEYKIQKYSIVPFALRQLLPSILHDSTLFLFPCQLRWRYMADPLIITRGNLSIPFPSMKSYGYITLVSAASLYKEHSDGLRFPLLHIKKSYVCLSYRQNVWLYSESMWLTQ